MVNRVFVTDIQIAKAIQTIQKGAIEAGREGVDVELTASGVLLGVLMDLGIQLDTTGEFV